MRATTRATTTVRNRALLGAAIIVALSTSFAVAPAQAITGPPDQAAAVKVSYAALGDSSAAGVGGGDYLDTCFTSPDGYAALHPNDAGYVAYADAIRAAGFSPAMG